MAGEVGHEGRKAEVSAKYIVVWNGTNACYESNQSTNFRSKVLQVTSWIIFFFFWFPFQGMFYGHSEEKAGGVGWLVGWLVFIYLFIFVNSFVNSFCTFSFLFRVNKLMTINDIISKCGLVFFSHFRINVTKIRVCGDDADCFGSFEWTGLSSADFSITVELTLAHFTTPKGWFKKLSISEIVC